MKVRRGDVVLVDYPHSSLPADIMLQVNECLNSALAIA
jgi:hypothetical protein